MMHGQKNIKMKHFIRRSSDTLTLSSLVSNR